MQFGKKIIGLSLALVCGVAMAQGPTFVTSSAAGTTSSEVFWPATATQQARVVGAIASSDKAGSALSFRTGVTPYIIGASNAAGTLITLTYTNGLAANDVIVIQKANGTCISGTISSFQTNQVTLAATTGSATVPGDEVYKMSAAITLPIGAATNVNYQGEALYVGNRGRPVRCVLDGTSTNWISTITARYE